MILLKEMISRSLFAESKVKKIRIFDFDDTVVKTKALVYVTNTKTGKEFELTPAQYAVYKPKGGDEFDYSDFRNVKEPIEIKQITSVLKRMSKRSDGDLFILTARAAYKPIKEYLNTIGVRNIYVVALDSADPQDKADWIEDKVDNEGYNDIYFIDDSPKNVRAVKEMLRTKEGIKWRVQHAKY